MAVHGQQHTVGTGPQGLLLPALDALTAIVQADAALALTVGVHDTIEQIVVRCPRQDDEPAVAKLARRLPELEAIDPFSPRRAAATGASVLSAAGPGSDEPAAASMYARHLRTFGFRLPVVLWLRIAGRITSGAMFLRRLSAREFDVHAVRLLNQWQPLLEIGLIPPDGADAGRFDDAAPPRLTLREAEVAALVADGASNAAIADSLGMSEATVKTHLTRVYAKLGVRSRTQLAVTLPQAPEVPVPTLR